MIDLPGYALLQELAAGASGTVFRARQLALGREVAVKLLTPGLFDVAETRARFLREAKLQARLAHPHLVAVYDAGFAGTQPYLVVELVEGGSLRQRMAGGALPLAEALRIGQELAAGLAHAHEAGIVHRDLKPENVLLTPEGSVKLADFGLAKADAASQTLQTGQGVILGTPGYLAPEILQGVHAGPAADLYALGVILYELLAGEPPFDGADAIEVLRSQSRGLPRPLESLAPELPRALVELVHRCLDSDPARRPQSAAQLAKELADGALRRATRARGPAAPRRAGREATGPAASAGAATRRGTMAKQVSRSADTVSGRAPAEAPAARERVSRGLLVALAGAGFCLLGWICWPGAGSREGTNGLPVRASGERAPARPTKPGPARTEPTSGRRNAASTFHCSTGATRLVLHFSEPWTSPATLTLSPAGRPEISKQYPVQAGMRLAEFDRLEPGTAYEGRLRSASLEAALSVRTLLPKHDARLVTLRPAGVKAEGARLVQRGQQLVAVWREEYGGRDHRIAGMDSADGGLTWTAPAPLSGRGQWAGEPALAACGGGLAAAWAAGTIDRNRVWLRLRPWSAQTWGPAVATHDLALADVPLLECGPPGEGRVTACGLAGQFSTAAFDSTGQPLGPIEPQFVLAPGIKCWGLLRLGMRRLALLEQDLPNRNNHLLWSAAPAGGPGTWSQPRPLWPEPARSVAAVIRGERLLTAFVNDKRVRARLFDDKLQPLHGGAVVFSEQSDGRTPALIAGDEGFLLAFADVELLGARIALVLARSADGLSWSIAHRVQLPLNRLRELCLVANSEVAQVLAVSTLGELILARLPLPAAER